jgi:hypothetical protein
MGQVCQVRPEWTWQSEKVLRRINIATPQDLTEVTVYYSVELVCFVRRSTFSVFDVDIDYKSEQRILISRQLIIMNVIVNISMMTYLRR